MTSKVIVKHVIKFNQDELLILKKICEYIIDKESIFGNDKVIFSSNFLKEISITHTKIK